MFSKELAGVIKHLLGLPEKRYQECKEEMEQIKSDEVKALYKKVFAEVDKRREEYKGAE